MLRPADLQAYIDQHHIPARLITDIGDTPTVPAAAAALGVHPNQIIKTLLFELAGNPVLPSSFTPLTNYELRIKNTDAQFVIRN